MNGNRPAKMLSRLLSLLLLMAFFFSVAAPALTVEAQTGSAAAVNTGKLNVRTGPGVIFAIITSIPYNTTVTLVGRASTGTWVQVRLESGTVGWVNSIHLRTYADYSLLPITYDTSIVVPPQTVPPPGGGVPGGGPTVYTVRAGDTLKTIAARYGTTWQAIAAANSLVNANYIYTGQRLIIPTGGSNPSPQPQPNPGVYIVQAGDTLAVIAARYGTTVAAIVTANNLPNANNIYAGQRLVIPSAPPPPRYYTVQAGDNLFRIALRYGVSVAAIQAANNIFNPNAIYAGQTLLIP